MAVSQEEGPLRRPWVCGRRGLGCSLQTCEKQISVFTHQPGHWGCTTAAGAEEGRRHWAERACVRCSGAYGSHLSTYTDHSPPGSSVNGILQAKILQWVGIFFFREIFPTQGSNRNPLCLLRWQADSLPLSQLGTPTEFRADPKSMLISF